MNVICFNHITRIIHCESFMCNVTFAVKHLKVSSCSVHSRLSNETSELGLKSLVALLRNVAPIRIAIELEALLTVCHLWIAAQTM